MIETKIYGQSDDKVYLSGEYSGQYSDYRCAKEGFLFIFNDGTILKINYGELGIWKIVILKKGNLFDRIELCDDRDADIYSDIVYFKEGINFVYACSEWQKVV